MFDTILLTLLVFIVLQLGLLAWQMVGIMRAILNVRKMVHDHVHGMTNYLAEAVGELRSMRVGAGMVPVDDEEEKDHGHHHN